MKIIKPLPNIEGLHVVGMTQHEVWVALHPPLQRAGSSMDLLMGVRESVGDLM